METIAGGLVRLPTEMGAAELAAKLRNGEISSREVVDAYIQRIETVNPRLNAIAFPMFDQARNAAAVADDARTRGERPGPLHGLPITIKESLRVAGTPTSLGLLSQKNWRADSEGPLVTRLRRAGAIILAKTNMSQLGLYVESDNPVYGTTSNPWNPARSPGGSSGGEAAIVAAAGSALGLGTDLGGSVRVPAHCCGVHTLKPTAGRLTRGDHRLDISRLVFSALGRQPLIVPQAGFLARRVEDLDLGMRVLAGSPQDRATDEVAPAPWPDRSAVRVGNLRVGSYEYDGFFPASPAIRRAVREAADGLRARGATVEPFSPPDVATAMRLFFSVNGADGGAGLRRALAKEPMTRFVKRMVQGSRIPRPMRPLVAGLMAARGQRYLAAMVRWMHRRSESAFAELLREVEAYRERFLSAMAAARLDALLSPPFALPALTHGASEHLFPPAASYAVLYNVLGWPAGVVAATRVRPGEESDRMPSRDRADLAALLVERGSEGLPVGVQVAARPWREDIVLAVMAALEEAFSARPDYPPRVGPVREEEREAIPEEVA